MCGIVGYVGCGHPIARDLLCAMRDRMSHRGPDDCGEWLSADGCVGLGQRRLSIVDLSPLGHQPMLSPDGRYVIVLNGEIYNHREIRAELEKSQISFRGTSDTEVALAAYQLWGTACLERFRGMFAIVIYDRFARKLFAARDRAGEKPFFYRHDGHRFVFASELKALLEHPDMPRHLSPRGLNHYLAFGYVPREGCILDGYNKLPAAHQLTFDQNTGRLEIGRYWSLPLPPVGRTPSINEQADKLEALLRDSLSNQLMADVPVGILLSGGLDSSLVAAIAARISSAPVRTYSIGFPGHSTFDESAHAKLVADYLGTEHTLLPADENAIGMLPDLIRQYDEPIADSSMIPTHMVSRLTRQHCTVALGGDGGDELFGGYLHYSWVDRLSKLRWLQLHQLGIEQLLSRAIPIGARGRSAIFALTGKFPAEITLNRLLDSNLRQTLVNSVTGWDAEDIDAPEILRTRLVSGRMGALNRLTALDFYAYMCDDILVKVDRASMLASLEVRAPFLDHKIIEFAFGEVPPDHKLANGQRKLLLRALARRLLPPEFDVARKQGFSIPLNTWLKGQWRPLVDNLMDGESPLFDPSRIRRAMKEWQGTDRGANRIFQLAVLEAWRREYRVHI